MAVLRRMYDADKEQGATLRVPGGAVVRGSRIDQSAFPPLLRQRQPRLVAASKVTLSELESDGRGQPDRRDFTDRSPDRGACRGRRAMPKDHSGFEGGDRDRRRIAARDDARPPRVKSGRRHRGDCRGAGWHRAARIERQHVATDDDRHERRRGAPFGSDRPDRLRVVGDRP
jgi:hypothetical protein